MSKVNATEGFFILIYSPILSDGKEISTECFSAVWNYSLREQQERSNSVWPRSRSQSGTCQILGKVLQLVCKFLRSKKKYKRRDSRRGVHQTPPAAQGALSPSRRQRIYAIWSCLPRSVTGRSSTPSRKTASLLISSGSRQMSRGRFPACWGRSFR